MGNEAATEESVLVVSRSFEASREAVFDAWLEATQLAKWMGPHGVRAEIDALEPKVGGRYRIIMHLEPGGTPTAGGVYREISRPDRLTDIPQMPSKFVEIVPLSHRQGYCIPFAAIRWHDFGNRPALGRPLGHFSRHPDTLLLSLSPRRRFPRPTPERVFAADHQSSSGFSGIGPSAPPPQPIGT